MRIYLETLGFYWELRIFWGTLELTGKLNILLRDFRILLEDLEELRIYWDFKIFWGLYVLLGYLMIYWGISGSTEGLEDFSGGLGNFNREIEDFVHSS